MANHHQRLLKYYLIKLNYTPAIRSSLTKDQAYVFDAYGTLLDINAASLQHSELLGKNASRVSDLWRRKQLEYTWLRSLMGVHVDFWEITKDALSYSLDYFDIDHENCFDELCASYLEIPCYAEVPQLLKSLKNQGKRIAVLSNGSPNMIHSAVNANKLEDMIDAILSVEDVGIFKPDRKVYSLVEEKLGIVPEKTNFFSSNAWDVAGASVFGFSVVWVNRLNQPAERLPGRPRLTVKNLEEWWEKEG
jgi:2-haloacid dehalogenase